MPRLALSNVSTAPASLALALTVLSAAVAPAARADDAGLHHARGGLMLDGAEQSTRLFFTALSAKVLDVEVSRTALGDVKRFLADARGSVFRTSQLLEDPKGEGEFKKLEETIGRAQEALTKLEGDFKSESAKMKVDEEGEGKNTNDDEGEAEQPDWDLLRSGTSALAAEVGSARSLHGKLGKLAKASPLKVPPPPKKK